MKLPNLLYYCLEGGTMSRVLLLFMYQRLVRSMYVCLGEGEVPARNYCSCVWYSR